ncbi:MAG TPA: tetratricopeptide repeat protein [Planktothrix sp.]|jgi:tetratricopeptide (TPR) repeat protein
MLLVIAGLIVVSSATQAEEPVAHHLKPGMSNFEMGQFDAALVEFKKAVAETPKDPQAHYYLGSTEAKLNQLDDALAEFRLAFALAPPGSQVRQYAQAALAACGPLAAKQRQEKSSLEQAKPKSAAGDTKKDLREAEGRARAIEAQAENKVRQMETATIRIGNLNVKRYTQEDISDVRLEARDKADAIRREARLKAQANAAKLENPAPRAR